jgi:hypothetical protein
MMPFTSVVLPVPGPPVTTRSFAVTVWPMASRCSGASAIRSRASNQAKAHLQGLEPEVASGERRELRGERLVRCQPGAMRVLTSCATPVLRLAGR